MYRCLVEISIISSPIAPFFMDRLYKDLISCTKKSSFESVHHENFPVSNDLEINTSLQNKIRKAQTICSLVLSLKKKREK